MNSCLYRCRVLHDRAKPKRHRFAYSCFVFCLDLDEIPRLARQLWAFSHNAANLYSLRDSDHLKEGADSIRQNILRFLRSSGIDQSIGRITLVTNLRTWGYVFNPVSFFFVHDTSGSPLCAVAEVANTFNEQKLYLLRHRDGDRFRQSLPKQFYISPFSDLDVSLDFDLAPPAETLDLRIDESDAEGTYFHSALVGNRRPLTNRGLLAITARFPFMTLSVIAAIHWQAAKMALVKKIPFHRKAANPHLQTATRVYLHRKSTASHNHTIT